jgi:hypothetical protein
VDIDGRAIIGIVFGSVFVAALVLYLGWRAAVLGVAAFAVWLLAVKRLDLPSPAPILLLLTFWVIGYFAEMRWRLKAFQRLADVLGASWGRGGGSVLGAIEGTFNGRKFKLDFVEKGEGRYAEKWLEATIACAPAGSEGLAEGRDGIAQAVDAAKYRLYGERRLLQPQGIRLLHAGKLAPGGCGLAWSCAGYINYARLPALLQCLDAIAGAVEQGRSGPNQAPS